MSVTLAGSLSAVTLAFSALIVRRWLQQPRPGVAAAPSLATTDAVPRRLLPSFSRPTLALDQQPKLSQFALVQVRDSAKRHPGLTPLNEMKPLQRRRLGRGSVARRRRPDEEIDGMLAALVNQGRHRPAVQIVEAPADQRETLGHEILHRGRKIELTLEPRFDRV